MKQRVGMAIARRHKQMEKPLIRKICECPNKDIFFTTDKKSKFKNIAHYNHSKLGEKRKQKKREHKFRLNKPYRDKPYMIAQRGVYVI